tara:strand:- start:210 stop:545 length:336 start_codon:yes stop_codon:yes gene_type:complete
MAKQHIELFSGDVIIFNKKSGSASFVTVKNKGTYFVPSKEEMKLDGLKIPIKRNEPFIYTDLKLLSVSGKNRIIRLSLNRIKTQQVCYISEFNMHKYFARPENPEKYLQES